MIDAAKLKLKTLSDTLEELLGPLLVFVISYAHHLYFADDVVSSSFAAFSLVSLLLVMAIDRTGILLAFGIQLAFLGWVVTTEPFNFTEQMLFSTSIALSLLACYLSKQPEMQETESQSLVDQKEKLWQELFDARQEIKSLYDIKSALDVKVADFQLLEHKLDALTAEKEQFIEDKQAQEADIKQFADNMHEMAINQKQMQERITTLQKQNEALQQAEQACPPEKPSEYEAKYRQLQVQFEEKRKTLDACRKELFLAQEEVSVLKKSQSENLGPTQEEKHLMQELAKAEDAIETLNKAHAEELMGYEEVIQGLLNQLQEKTSS